MKKNNGSSGVGLGSVILIVLIILKLTGNITWSWLWVLSPLWIPFGIVLLVFVIVLILNEFKK